MSQNLNMNRTGALIVHATGVMDPFWHLRPQHVNPDRLQSAANMCIDKRVRWFIPEPPRKPTGGGGGK
ncbi:hypothetical protein UFOVP1040_58 [uncultured Caudovirales phage]|uniref:Uncharacterized protein n=1 Tax=uncultured Caudovirales phage TaxID=2100421 RepID=A0A6J5QLH0_9CAUD|nr:hypothetical protein UFOVP1040_58 [uncultured Caudovirales phage]